MTGTFPLSQAERLTPARRSGVTRFHAASTSCRFTAVFTNRSIVRLIASRSADGNPRRGRLSRDDERENRGDNERALHSFKLARVFVGQRKVQRRGEAAL